MKMNRRIALKEAVKFHGHLGPYLILGLLAGRAGLEKTGSKKYFGLEVKVWGANKKPRSCLIDGLQLSTGCTYGKGNITKLNGRAIKMEFNNRIKQKKVIITFQGLLLKKIEEARTHRDSELLARQLYKTNYSKIFKLRVVN